MVYLESFFASVFVLTVNGVGNAAINEPLVTIYYESNCPDSKYFVTQQLQPAMQQLQGLVRLRFVPFGKATSIDYGLGGFKCQHGPNECFGNMIQDCTLEEMAERTDWDKLQYVVCEMKTYAASQGNYQCVEQAQVPPMKVQNCLYYNRGTSLQLNSEYLTSLVPNTKIFIPTITVDNEFSQKIQDYAMVDLLGTLCSFISNMPPCATYYNQLAWKKIMYKQETPPLLSWSLKNNNIK